MFRRPGGLPHFFCRALNTDWRPTGRTLVCVTEFNGSLRVLSQMGLAHGSRRTRRRGHSKKPSIDRRRFLPRPRIFQNYGRLS